jgi:ureidoglycolate amidohydrolase
MIMSDRHDALLAGAEFALAVEAAALKTGSDDTVATTGVMDVEPGAENSIGRRVRVSLDVRDTDQARRDGVVAAARSALTEIGRRRGVKVTFTSRSRDAPARCDRAVVDAVEGAAKGLGYAHGKLVSRAYHDSLLMATKFPIGMVFIPCRGGVSHHPSEYSSEEQMDRGIRTLALTLAKLAGGEWRADGEASHRDEL